MKIKKKYANGCILFYVQNTPAKINFAKILKVFNIKNTYVEILDCIKKEPEFINFLDAKNIKYATKTKVGLNLSATLPDKEFDEFFKNTSKVKFDELKIWNSNLMTAQDNEDLSYFHSIFYIDYLSSSADYFEIVCDKTYDKEDLESQLETALTSE